MEKVSKIKTRKAELEILEEVYDFLNRKLTDSPFQQYKIVGKSDKQRKNWSTGELMWEDDDCTIPVYEDKWDDVPVPEDEYTEEMWTRKAALENLLKRFDDLVK